MTLAGRRFDWGSRTYVMGILNLTDDSFAGDGLGADVEAAVAQAERFAREGADILDLGAESTRPGFTPVSVEQQIARLLPVLYRLRDACDLPLSVDTANGEVARGALAAGASLINDTGGLRGDGVAAAVAGAGAAAVAMHNQRGRPFLDVVDDIRRGVGESFEVAEAAGLPREQLIIDPGLGFGWEPAHNLEIVRRLGELRDLGRPILIGPSRKSTIGAVLDVSINERWEGTAALVALGIANGADIVRVHDVAAMRRVARMTDAVMRGWTPENG
jgi:dihydropteroate synthase